MLDERLVIACRQSAARVTVREEQLSKDLVTELGASAEMLDPKIR